MHQEEDSELREVLTSINAGHYLQYGQLSWGAGHGLGIGLVSDRQCDGASTTIQHELLESVNSITGDYLSPRTIANQPNLNSHLPV